MSIKHECLQQFSETGHYCYRGDKRPTSGYCSATAAPFVSEAPMNVASSHSNIAATGWLSTLNRHCTMCHGQYDDTQETPRIETTLVLSTDLQRTGHRLDVLNGCRVFHFILFVANLDSLSDRRDKLSRTFIQNMCKPASCLHHLLPPPRNTSPISRLRSSIPLPRPTSRTKSSMQSFVNFALNKYQSPL